LLNEGKDASLTAKQKRNQKNNQRIREKRVRKKEEQLASEKNVVKNFLSESSSKVEDRKISLAKMKGNRKF
jgi:hypothetical protein